MHAIVNLFNRRGLIASFACAWLATGATAAITSPEFIDPGTVPGMYGTTAYGVSPDGTYVVGESGMWGFRWTAANGMQRLGAGARPYWIGPRRVASDGRVAGSVGFESPLAISAYRWNSNWSTGTIAGTVIGPPIADHPFGVGSAISNDGEIVVGSRSLPDIGWRAFIWTSASGVQILDTLPAGYDTFANDISGDGSVIVGESGTACRWTLTDGIVDLGALSPFTESSAQGVSADGRVAVGYSGDINFGAYVATRWVDDGPPVAIEGFPQGTSNSIAYDTNRDGSVIVGQYFWYGEPRGFIWTVEAGLIDFRDYMVSLGIPMTYIPVRSCRGVSDNASTIVGEYQFASRYNHAFIARDLPLGDNECPSCAADFDRDGGITGGDLCAFIGAYYIDDDCTDLNGDGAVTPADVLAFFELFERGGCE